MKKQVRLSGAERRAAIIDAAQRVFAERGFGGTTTRELAAKAGVSEALLFKHFPSKEALFTAMLDTCCESDTGLEFRRILALPPGTSTLAMLLHFISKELIYADDKKLRNIHQLMLHSMAEDGVFVRVMFKDANDELMPAIRNCVQAARRASDLRDGTELKDGEWFAHHVFLMIAFMHLHKTPLVKYATERDQRVKESVLFMLRGLGFHEEAIRQAYNAKVLKAFKTTEYADARAE